MTGILILNIPKNVIKFKKIIKEFLESGIGIWKAIFLNFFFLICQKKKNSLFY